MWPYMAMWSTDIFDLIDNRPALEPTTMSSLVAIGPAEVEI